MTHREIANGYKSASIRCSHCNRVIDNPRCREEVSSEDGTLRYFCLYNIRQQEAPPDKRKALSCKNLWSLRLSQNGL
jgi:hypothetical protein